MRGVPGLWSGEYKVQQCVPLRKARACKLDPQLGTLFHVYQQASKLPPNCPPSHNKFRPPSSFPRNRFPWPAFDEKASLVRFARPASRRFLISGHRQRGGDELGHRATNCRPHQRDHRLSSFSVRRSLPRHTVSFSAVLSPWHLSSLCPGRGEGPCTREPRHRFVIHLHDAFQGDRELLSTFPPRWTGGQSSGIASQRTFGIHQEFAKGSLLAPYFFFFVDFLNFYAYFCSSNAFWKSIGFSARFSSFARCSNAFAKYIGFFDRI